VHTPPLLPQLAYVVPATQVPVIIPCARLQQPPLQGVLASQVAPQVFVIRLHALPATQSAEELHPQVTMLLTVTQAPPFMLPTHEVPPAAVAHWSKRLPAEQVPAFMPCGMLQQPPLQALLASQPVPHAPALHA